MNQNSENENHPKLEQQMETAVWAVLSEPLPVGAIDRVKQRAKELTPASAPDLAPPARQSKRRRSFPTVVRYALAASLLAMIVGGFSLLGGSNHSNNLYAQVAKNLEAIQSLVCRVQFSPTASLDAIQHQQNSQEVTYLAPSLHRIEDKHLGTVEIIDGQQNKMIRWVNRDKQALVTEGFSAALMDALSPATLAQTLLRHFRVDRLNDEGIESLGLQTHDGVTLQGYESTLNGEIVRAWFDSKSLAPVTVAFRFEIPEQMIGSERTNDSEVKMWRIMSDIELNTVVDRGQFSLTAPDGFETIDFGNVAVDLTPASLADMIDMLTRCAEINDLNFPLSMSMTDDEGTPMAIQRKHVALLEEKFNDGTAEEKAALVESMKQFVNRFSRGSAFPLTMQPENDWHYFGGAKLNQADRPILWYSPNADDNYTILYADLTVTEVTRAELPTPPAAVVKSPQAPSPIIMEYIE